MIRQSIRSLVAFTLVFALASPGSAAGDGDLDDLDDLDDLGWLAGCWQGEGQVAAQWRRFFESPQAPFSWRPETVEILDSGTLALSTGPVYDPGGKLISRFASIWRREASGDWRIVFDKGERVCEEPASAQTTADR